VKAINPNHPRSITTIQQFIPWHDALQRNLEKKKKFYLKQYIIKEYMPSS